jgi:cAMP-dependent protein kinase regulator
MISVTATINAVLLQIIIDLQTTFKTDLQHVLHGWYQMIIQQGSAGDWFYMTEEGEASADIATSLGHTTVRKYGPGDFFGELSLLMGGPRAASVRADTRYAAINEIKQQVSLQTKGDSNESIRCFLEASPPIRSDQ